jgi:hypothetical protein
MAAKCQAWIDLEINLLPNAELNGRGFVDEQKDEQEHIRHKERHEAEGVVWSAHHTHDVRKILAIFISIITVSRLIEGPKLELEQILDPYNKLQTMN